MRKKIKNEHGAFVLGGDYLPKWDGEKGLKKV